MRRELAIVDIASLGLVRGKRLSAALMLVDTPSRADAEVISRAAVELNISSVLVHGAGSEAVHDAIDEFLIAAKRTDCVTTWFEHEPLEEAIWDLFNVEFSGEVANGLLVVICSATPAAFSTMVTSVGLALKGIGGLGNACGDKDQLAGK